MATADSTIRSDSNGASIDAPRSDPTRASSLAPVDSVEGLDGLNRDEGWNTIEYRQLAPGRLRSAFIGAGAETGGLRLSLEQHDQSLEVYCVGPPRAFTFLTVVHGEARLDAERFAAGDLVALDAGEVICATVRPGTVVGTTLVTGPLADLARAALGANRSASLAPRRSIADQGAVVHDQARFVGRIVRGEAVSQSDSERLVETLTVVEQIRRARRVDLGADRRRRAISRARAYVDQHLHESIRMPALGERAEVSDRTLERHFRRETGLSPQGYVLARRLNAARRRLLEGAPAGVLRVTDVALDHGFSHPGRFAALYRAHFGEGPSETLRLAIGPATRGVSDSG